MDNSEHTQGDGRPDSNQIRATINGKDISVKANTDMPARAEVRKENGALVARQDSPFLPQATTQSVSHRAKQP